MPRRDERGPDHGGQPAVPPRWARTGTEPSTARSALGLRLVLSLAFLPLFLAGTALLWYWTLESGPKDVPSNDSLRVLAVACALLAFLALADLVLVLLRRRGAGPYRR